MRKVVLIMAILSVVLFIGCASIVSGTSQKVTFNSVPSGAKVITDTGLTLITPSTATLPKGKSISVRCEQEGYESQTQVIGTSFNGWFIGNLLFGGLIGMIIDAADGAMMNLDKDNVNFFLTPKEKRKDDVK
ncbi:MAG: hypothetical protein V1871_03095 [Planctomycetota bacterium]